ncbi:MAG TPA: hypothetical protein VNK95_19835 [Caldilineaceae bacterium]|nr:hypothetical protein [Caldilineaceae bacterium]
MAWVTLMVATVAAPVTYAQPMRRSVAHAGEAHSPSNSPSSSLLASALAHLLLAAQADQLAQLSQVNTPEATPQATATPRLTQTLLPGPTVAPTATVTPTLTPTPATETITVTAAQAGPSTPAATETEDEAEPESDAPASPTIVPAPTVTATALPAQAAPITAAATVTQTAPLSATAAGEAPLEGTIVTNRSDNNARFFVEGMTYELEAGRSMGLSLPRSTSVLNLYNCDAATPESTGACFWDPYLITQNGFYEIYNAPEATAGVRLLLREAGTPPTDQVWVQNRTGQAEQVVYRNEVYELPPTSVHEFAVASGVPAILYVRNCLTLDGQSVCEWTPKTLNAGVYYALVAVERPGAETGSEVMSIDLRPVVADVAAPSELAAAAEATLAPAPGEIICRLAVPVLNVRSGPGLQYEIVDKVRTTEAEPATVAVTGRSADSQWLTVAPSVAEDGWITASPSFVTCDGDLNSLPVVEAPAPPPTPEPVATAQESAPVVVLPEEEPSEPNTEPQPQPEQPEAPPAQPEANAAIPEGQALLVVNNGFQHDIRFTLDQQFRPQEGPSEYDLPPGGSVSIVVYPGRVAFTASSPWGGLSGNAEIQVEANQAVPLWLRFEPDPGNSGQWLLAWQ